MKTPSIAILILVYGLVAYGRLDASETYYVDKGDSTCSDTVSAGSESNPWCSITYALSRMSGGDDLFVKSGTYNEFPLMQSHLTGTSDDVTKIQVHPGDNVTLKGIGVHTGRVKIDGVDYLTFDGFTITNYNQGLFVEGASNHIVIQNLTINFVGQEAIHVKENSNYITIQNCTIHDTRQWSGSGNGNGEGMYIGTGSAGPKDNSSFIFIRDNLVYNTIHEGIELKPGTHDCIVERNHVYNVSTKHGAIEVGEPTLGEQHWGQNANHIIRDNIIHDTDTAMRLANGCLVYNNVIYDVNAGKYGIYIHNRSGDSYVRRIYHNTIDHDPSLSVYVRSGRHDVKNNIGSSMSDNIPLRSSFFVNTSEGNEDYHLKSGSAPIDGAVDLTGIVPFDLDGGARPAGSAPDFGAYEFGAEGAGGSDRTPPNPPSNLRIIQ